MGEQNRIPEWVAWSGGMQPNPTALAAALDAEAKFRAAAAPAAAPSIVPELLTVAEVAAMMQLNRNTIYSLIAEDKLPGVRRFGRAVRVHRATVVAWLASDQERSSRSRR